MRKNLSRLSLFSGGALAMAFSLLSVVVLLVWWQRLLIRNLDLQYGFFRSEIQREQGVSPGLQQYISEQDEKLASQLFGSKQTHGIRSDAGQIIEERLHNRRKMVFYEQAFFIVLLLSGHFFFLYIYFRERTRRRMTEETILLATHELRQPLQSLSLALETVAPHAKGRSRDAIQNGLQDIGKLSQQIRWLAATFSGTETNHDSVTLQDFPVYIRNLVNEEFNAAEQQRFQLNFKQQRGVNLKLSAAMLHFVLRNLLENALKYAAGSVAVSALWKGNSMQLTISSSGRTLSNQEFRRIGSIFYRSNRAEVQNTPGFGLGLYLASRIARRAGGKLIIEHDKKGRTTAILKLRTQ